MLEPKLRMYLVFAQSQDSISGPHDGSSPTFLEDSQTLVWFTMVFEPSACMKRLTPPPVRLRPHLNAISLRIAGSPSRSARSITSRSLPARIVVASS